MSGALNRYRVIASVVGVFLLVLVFVAMPLKYFADEPGLVAIVGPIHGFLYIIYLVLGFDLCHRARWSLKRTALVLLSGTIPFLTFWTERQAVRWARTEALV